jgi:hypothetical protein
VVVAAARRQADPAHRGEGNARGQRVGSPSRDTVRRVVAATATRHGVDPQLALAVSWQESGWQMDRRSGAGAIGVRLLSVLDSETPNRRRAVAAYYQGLGAVRSDGLYGETRAYVANVLALKRRLEAGLPPA